MKLNAKVLLFLVLATSTCSLAAVITIMVPVDKDVHVATYSPTTNLNGDHYLKVQHGWESSFVQASTLTTALAGYTSWDIVSAKYKFHAASNNINYVIGVAVLTPWQDSMLVYNDVASMSFDWNTQSSVQFAPNFTSFSGWAEMDVTTAVKKWVSGTNPNYGWHLYAGYPNTDIYILSQENTLGPQYGSYFEIKIVQGNVPMIYTNPWTDNNGNTWAVYDINDTAQNKAYESLSNYNLMTWYQGTYEDYWLGVNNLYGHPSYGLAYDQTGVPILTSIRYSNPTVHYIGALSFLPASAGLYRINGSVFVQDWNEALGYNDTVLTFGKFSSSGQWQHLYTVQGQHNQLISLLNAEALQAIPLAANERLVLLVRPAMREAATAVAWLKGLQIEPVVLNTCADVQQIGYSLDADLNGDCVVNINDLKLFIQDWLK